MRILETTPLDYSYFLVAENTISAFEYTHKLQETQAEPAVDINGIAFLFSGHLAPTFPVNAFMSS